MNFTCPACHTSYTIEDGRVQGRVVRARCRNCGSAIDVAKLTQGSQRGAHTRAPRLYQASSSVSAAKVRQYRAPYQDTYEAQRERPHAEQASYEQAHSYEHAPQYDQASYEHAPQQHAARGPYEGSYEGDFPQAPAHAHHAEQFHGHDEPDEEPPTHAFESPAFRRGNDAARRADARPKRDLFAPTPPEDVPAIREIAAPIARVAGGSFAVGQRAENSVLFTLAALEPPKRRTEAAKAAAPADDHSGMIDLFALARAAKTSPQEASPLFATEPPLGAFTTELAPPLARAQHPARKRKAQLLAAGAVSALITGLAVFLFIGASSDAPVAKAAPKPVAAAAAPAAVAPPVAAAAPGDPALIPVSAKMAAAPAARGKGKAARPSHRAGAPAVTKSRAATAPAASDPCHCRGNLLCAMKCSV